MRLLCVTPATQDGGTERCVEAVCAGAQARGWDVVVAAAAAPEAARFHARLRAAQIPLHLGTVSSRPLAFGAGLAAAADLLALAKKLGADAVWVALPWATAVTVERLALAAAGYPVLSSFFLVDRKLERRPWRFGYRWTWRVGTQAETALCAADADRLASAFAVEAEVIPPGNFHPPPEGAVRRQMRDRARARLGLAADDFAVVTLARLEPQKALDAVLDAAAATRSRLAHATFFVAGEGSRRRALEARLAKEGLSGRVRLLGHAEPEALLAAADAFALPSRVEGVPLALIEALAWRVPIVAAAVGGVPELLEHGRSGTLIPPACGVALAAALETLACGPLTEAELERRADRAAARYAPEAFVDGMLAALERVAAAAPTLVQAPV